MSRLSIVIPAFRQQEALESTLLSVLENRPPGCEAIVVCDSGYQDNYGLDDEVRFVRMPNRTKKDWHTMANLGVTEGCGEFIHVLQPGAVVEDGWTDSAIEVLDYEPNVAAVAPLIFSDGQSAPLTGVALGRSGRRIELRQDTYGEQDRIEFSPSQIAGFYRRSSLVEVGGWDASMTPDLADVELGCALALAGHSSKVSRLCQVRYDDYAASRSSGFADGLACERMIRRYEELFDRNIASSALFSALKILPNPVAVTYLAGRLAGRLRATRRTRCVGLCDVNSQNSQSRAA